ncbi:MAG: DNA polymerase III subunit gamma and tau [Bowdeniella nasicola]|nr:DNA polymerase III subunit gamma and tau [Bowdeniella nasicola]
MSTALYRRYRPDTFADVIGQEHVTDPLAAALRAGRVSHAYLFSGPRGCGKTTSARIFARCLNCVEGPTDTPCGECPSCRDLATGGSGSLDVVEIDAASHNGVDDARDLRERAAFAPARDRYKIFILDEAHMVTPQGFNALLKLVEEPPPHVKFVFATTEPEKVIGTIRSRTHHYPFRLVPPEVMTSYLRHLCDEEGVTVEDGVLPLVVRAGGGSVRDSLSVLDQLMAGAIDGAIDYDRATQLLGFTSVGLLDDAVGALAGIDGAALFRVVDHVVESGHDPRRFTEDLLQRLRDLVVLAIAGDDGRDAIHGVPDDQLDRMAAQATQLGARRASASADATHEALNDMSGATSPRLQFELLCARLILVQSDAGSHAAPQTVGPSQGEAGADNAHRGGQGSRTLPAMPTFGTPREAHASAGRRSEGVSEARPAPRRDAPEGLSDSDADRATPERSVGARSESRPTVPLTPPRPGTSGATAVSPPASESGAGQDAGGRPAGPDTVEPGAKSKTASGGDGAAAEPTPAQEAAGQDRTEGRASTAEDTDLLRRRWADVLEALKPISRVTWSLVQEHASVGPIHDGTVAIVFRIDPLLERFMRPEQPTNAENLAEAIFQALGLRVAVRGVSARDVSPEGEALSGGEPTQARTAPDSPRAREPSASPEAQDDPTPASPEEPPSGARDRSASVGPHQLGGANAQDASGAGMARPDVGADSSGKASPEGQSPAAEAPERPEPPSVPLPGVPFPHDHLDRPGRERPAAQPPATPPDRGPLPGSAGSQAAGRAPGIPEHPGGGEEPTAPQEDTDPYDGASVDDHVVTGRDDVSGVELLKRKLGGTVIEEIEEP